jgi:hypothetical protein
MYDLCSRLCHSHIALRELKQEARRICILDHTVRLESTSLPDRTVDWSALARDVEQAKSYLRSAKYAIDEPELYEVVGAYVVDDVVPKALRSEVHDIPMPHVEVLSSELARERAGCSGCARTEGLSPRIGRQGARSDTSIIMLACHLSQWQCS